MSARRSGTLVVLLALLAVALAVPPSPPAVARAPAAPSTAAGPGAVPVVRYVLPNGLRLLVRPLAGSGLAAVSLLVGASSRAEEASQAGVAVFTREVMLRGTAARTGAEIALALESLGGT
ncbi:MAG: insulinase family protein, partial [Armatimonadota bacterium]|nr:insulinase family protein [Armatimonadota bacterium]